MILGHVYDLDLKKNESLIKEVIIQAQGEVSNFLECKDFIKRIPSDGTGGIR